MSEKKQESFVFGVLKYTLYLIVGLFIAFKCIGDRNIPSIDGVDYEASLNTSSTTRQSIQLSDRLEYLNELNEIAWYGVDGNSVYVGFMHPLPTDLKQICNAAAYHGNKTIQFGCHVYAVDAKTYPSYASVMRDNNWRCLYSVTYRHGKMK